MFANLYSNLPLVSISLFFILTAVDPQQSIVFICSAVLAIWRVGGHRDRWPAAGQRRKAHVRPLSRGKWILECLGWKSLCQVRPDLYFSGKETGDAWAIAACFFMFLKVKRLLWSSLWRFHHWRFRGFYRWSLRDVRAPERSERSLQNHRQSPGERLAAGLLHRCENFI